MRASARKLRELMERRLDAHDFVAVVMDRKRFGDDGIIIALGITMEGKKVVLGLIQAGTENHRVCRDFLLEPIERGLKYDKGASLSDRRGKGVEESDKRSIRNLRDSPEVPVA